MSDKTEKDYIRHACGCVNCDSRCECTEGCQPPVAKYRLTITIRGNSHDEIVDELVSMTRGGYLLASDYYKRDEFDSTGGRDRMVLEHTNPDQTPEQYREQLDTWFGARKAARR